eukprot:UN01327
MIHAISNKNGTSSGQPNKRRHLEPNANKQVAPYGGSAPGGYGGPAPSPYSGYDARQQPHSGYSNPYSAPQAYSGYDYGRTGGASGYGPSPHALAGNGAPQYGQRVYQPPAQPFVVHHQFTLQGVVEEYRALVSEFARPNMGSSFVVLLVEYSSVGAIVGRGGEIVTKLQKELNCKINIAKN